jgi:hypothetical protein
MASRKVAKTPRKNIKEAIDGSALTRVAPFLKTFAP